MTPFILVCMFITAWCREHPIQADKAIASLHGCFLLVFYLTVPPFLMTLYFSIWAFFWFVARILLIGVAIKEINIVLWATCNFWCAVTIDRITPDFARRLVNDVFFTKHCAFNQWKLEVNKCIKLIKRGY